MSWMSLKASLAFLIHDEERALADAVILAIRAVLSWQLHPSDESRSKIVRKSTETFGPRGVARHAVNRYAQHLGIVAFEAFEVGLVRRHLRRSDGRPGQRVKRQHYVVLAAEI